MWHQATARINRYWIAQMFLTRLPVPKTVKWSELALAESTVYFPVVGLTIGLIAAVTYEVCAILWTTELAAVITVALAICVTGAFHDDGLADSADGIGGAFDIDKKLVIMRDSRIGTYGSVALILSILAKVFAIIAIDHNQVVTALITAHCLSRWTPLPLIAYNRYLREDGSGRPFAASVSTKQLIKATLFVTVVSVIFSQWLAPILLCAVALFTWLAQGYLRNKLGGITGDTLGAVNSLAELTVYLVFSLSIIS